MKLFSGRAGVYLAKEVAKLLNINVAESEIVTFANSEIRVRIKESVKNNVCVVIQSTSKPTNDNIIELFLFCDALKRQEASKIIGIIPYFGYARQDIQHRTGECVSANVMIRFLETIGFNKIYTFDIHDEATSGVFKIPFKNLSAIPILAESIKKDLKLGKPNPNKIAIVSPDQGGIERARIFGKHFFGNPYFSITVIEKNRNPNALHDTKALNLYGNVGGKIAILVDDIITSGKTIINAAEMCISKGALKTYASIVHHEFSKETIEKIKSSNIQKIYTSDTIPFAEEKHFKKLKEVSIAPLIADELKQIAL